jgi:transcriptional regulator with GAF, ATPase, and Fis domain
VGKDVLANAIHQWSDRAGRPMVRVNCAALPGSLIESELFGHVKGAFSGATSRRIGRFQASDGGTLFLDEIGEMPLDTQVKLLRVLQEGTFEPVGSDSTVRVDVRIIAATNRDLRAAIGEKRFREDLYYRLAVFPIVLPPLRLRRDDIAGIARSFLQRHARRTGRGPWSLDSTAIASLESRAWPGNVRELVNVLERATILARDSRLRFLDPEVSTRKGAPSESLSLPTLQEAECDLINRALVLTGGKIYGPGGAADMLDINPSTLASRMRKHGLGGARSRRPLAP